MRQVFKGRYAAWLIVLFLILLQSACNPPSVSKLSTTPTRRAIVGADPTRAAYSRSGKEIGPNVYFEKEEDFVKKEERRRVLINAVVCLRQGYLEHLLSRTEAQKQHESILTGDFDARHIHAALLAAGATPGKPAQFVNEKNEIDFKPASGDKIKVTLQYEEKGKTKTVPAQRWVRENKTKKELTHDWVFAGSREFPDPERKRPPYYGANEGRVICVSNFSNALLDLPIASTDQDADLLFEVNTELIPPLGTKVIVILEPLAKAEAPKK